MQINSFFIVIDQFLNLIAFLTSAASATTCFNDSEIVYTFEHLSNVLKDRLWILGLTDDLEQILIRQEVESGELSSL